MSVRRWRVLSCVAAVILGGTVGIASPAVAADPPETGTVTSGPLGFGGTYTGITYSTIWSGKRPPSLMLSGKGQTFQATAYLTNRPKFNPYPLLTPKTGPVSIDYYWQAECNVPGKGTKLFQLTAPRVVEVPVHPAASIFSPTPPSLTVTDTVTMPNYTCSAITILHKMNDLQRGAYRANITYFTPDDRYDFVPERDEDGRIRLYTVVDDKTVQAVERTGELTNFGANYFRYYFTNCALAREFIGVMNEAVLPNAKMGIIEIPGPADVVGSLVGATATRSGAPDIVVWGLEEGAILSYESAEVAYDGGNPVEGCAP